jgi:hypothetical protein
MKRDPGPMKPHLCRMKRDGSQMKRGPGRMKRDPGPMKRDPGRMKRGGGDHVDQPLGQSLGHAPRAWDHECPAPQPAGD